MIVNITIYPNDAAEIIYYWCSSHFRLFTITYWLTFIYMPKLILFDSDVDVKIIISLK